MKSEHQKWTILLKLSSTDEWSFSDETKKFSFEFIQPHLMLL